MFSTFKQFTSLFKLENIRRIYLTLFISMFSIVSNSQTVGDAVIYPTNYIGKKIEFFFFDVKGNASGVNSSAKATDYYITDDMNGIRISIYGDDAHPAHPSAGTVLSSEYTAMINSIKNARAARSGKDFYVFASKKLDGQNSFPAWTKDANGVIVTEYVKLLIDYFQFMKNNDITIDYLAIQNEEMYNEGNITPAKHKAIVDSVRAFTARMKMKMPLIIGYEDYGPNKNNWMKNLFNNNWIDYMDVYGTHYYPHLRPISGLNEDLKYANAAQKPFWSTEPHWDNKSDVDDWQEAEEGMCALWDQVEVGMTGFMWWAYARSGSLRGNLMRAASVPLKDAQMIDMNDVDGRGTMTNGKLQTRAFRENNLITVYVVNNHVSNVYTNYGFGISEGSIVGNVSATQWTKASGSIDGATSTLSPESASKFRMTIPAQSISIFSFNIDTNTSINDVVKGSLKLIHNNNVLQIITDNPNVGFHIFNSNGQLVDYKKRNQTVDTSNFSKGIYIVKTSNGVTERFVI